MRLVKDGGMSEFGKCVMELAIKRGAGTQAELGRRLASVGYQVKDRTLANYLYGRSVVDPALPVYLSDALALNKTEKRYLAECYTFGQPPRGSRNRRLSLIQAE
jgi:hypothetical protein